MSSLDKEKTAPETSKKPSGTENIKNIAKQDILDLSNDEHLQKMKERYGEDENSFIKGIRGSEDYGKKCQKMTDKEVLDFAKTDPGLKQYHAKVIEKKVENKKPEGKEKNEKKEEKKETVENKSEKKVEEIKTEKKVEKVEEKTKEQETKPEKKIETPKESTPPVEKSESKPEEKKPEDKKPEVKKETKKHFRSGRFKKKEKSEKKPEDKKEKKPEDKKEKKAGFISRVGSGIGKGIKAIPHQTWNLVSYAPRVARHTLGKYPFFDWINHGFNKPGLKKNRDNYASKWKWEQAAKKK